VFGFIYDSDFHLMSFFVYNNIALLPVSPEW
jgi:hypothetical protein